MLTKLLTVWRRIDRAAKRRELRRRVPAMTLPKILEAFGRNREDPLMQAMLHVALEHEDVAVEQMRVTQMEALERARWAGYLACARDVQEAIEELRKRAEEAKQA